MNDRYVYPRNNLPPASVSWGRTVENSNETVATGIARLKDELQGENRSKQGQAATIGKNLSHIEEAVVELSARSAAYFTEPNITRQFSISGNSSNIVGDTRIALPPPADSTPRYGQLFVSYTGYNSNPSNTWAWLYSYFYVSLPDGTERRANPPLLMAPDSDPFLGAPAGVNESGFAVLPFVWLPEDPYDPSEALSLGVSVSARFGRFPASGTYSSAIGIGGIRMAVVYGERYYS